GGKSGRIDGIQSWLICQISQDPVTDIDDKVQVNFHFGAGINTSTDTAGAIEAASPSLMAVNSLASSDVRMETLKSTAARGKNSLPPYEEQLQPFTRPFE